MDSRRKNILKDGAYRRPNPKLNALRSVLRPPWSSSQRAGLNASGSGKKSVSREMALRKLLLSPYLERRCLPLTCDHRGPGGNAIVFLAVDVRASFTRQHI